MNEKSIKVDESVNINKLVRQKLSLAMAGLALMTACSGNVGASDESSKQHAQVSGPLLDKEGCLTSVIEVNVINPDDLRVGTVVNTENPEPDQRLAIVSEVIDQSSGLVEVKIPKGDIREIDPNASEMCGVRKKSHQNTNSSVNSSN